MTPLADDPTAAAVLAAVPCHPVPPSGRSAAIDALRATRNGHGFVIGCDGLMLILRRPWLALDVAVTPSPTAYLPYGEAGKNRADLLCGLIPDQLRAAILDHLRAARPHEAAAFVIWDEAARTCAVDFPTIDEAPSSSATSTPPTGRPWPSACVPAVCFCRCPAARSLETIMLNEGTNRHFLPAGYGERGIEVLLVGCGGNGAQMLMGLASLDAALRAISSRSLHVTVVDDDTVTEANLGRQPFYRCDLGASKARTLVERINIAHGLDWRAVHGRAPAAVGLRGIDILITCVDTAAARRAIGAAFVEVQPAPR